MNKSSFKRLGLKLVLLAVLVLPELASAQSFSTSIGDVLLGFRKTVAPGLYELVVDAGNVTNFLNLSAGQSINITNYSASQLTNAFTDTGNFANLQWSAFAAGVTASGRNPAPWVTPLGSFAANTIWYTVPSTNVNTQTQPPSCNANSSQANQLSLMQGAANGAKSIAVFLNVTNQNNNANLVREPVSYFNGGNGYTLSCSIGESVDSYAIGDFGLGLATPVENTTPSPFTSAQRDDLYQLVPTGYTDPITGLPSGTAYFVGYFLLNPDGSMTFTRASVAPAAPVVGSVASSVTNGFAPLQVIFTNTASSGGTNWVWNFGNGSIITNTTSTYVTNIYATGGSYTVTLTVNGAGGSSTNTLTNYIAVVASGFTGTPTNGFAPLKVVFTNISTGVGNLTVTNLWNFGNGTIITNLTGGNVTNTYTSAGTNTVTLTVKGSGGSSTNTQANYIVALPTPTLSTINLSGGKMVFSCSNSPSGVQYRILSSTNLTLSMANWIPVVTNTFPNTYTNYSMTNARTFFRLVSP